MKKRYKLNNNGKMLVFTMVMITITVVGTMLFINRNEKIENGTMITQYDSQIDR